MSDSLKPIAMNVKRNEGSLSLYSALLLAFVLLNTATLSGQHGRKKTEKWVATWSTALQLVEPRNNPPSPGLTDNSLRQIVRVSIGGKALRLKLSNEFSKEPVTLHSVQIAASAGQGAIDNSTNVKLTFNGCQEITLDPGSVLKSDPVTFNLKAGMDLAITIYFGGTSPDITGHPGSRTISYILPGNDVSVTDFSGSVPTEHWYGISSIDVLAPSSASCVAILGNSITDGRGSTTDLQNRWPDMLAERLRANADTRQTGVLNLGIGGNCILRDCLGPAAVKRYERDILTQPGVKWVIIFEGVNDIGRVRSADDAATVADGLIDAYGRMIDSAHSAGLKVYGATITPFKGNSYYNRYSEACRNEVNGWIRNSGRYDAVIDFDNVLKNPDDPESLVSSFQNDSLHPDTAGFRKMADCIDLTLFADKRTARRRAGNRH
jgi:lysophospholipase L1-like esterase